MSVMAGVGTQSDSALASLTGALVDANDRLLGLLSLITSEPPPSLAAPDMVDAVIDRAAPILGLDHVSVVGTLVHSWTQGAPTDHEGEWSTTIELADSGDLEMTFHRKSRRFDTGDTKLLAAVARLVANAVATARVHEQTVSQEVVAREHATAAQVAAAALPDPATMPTHAGVSFFAQLTPARETGGDLYTWREIDESIWFAIGDVSGKGLPAAVLMSTAVSAVDAAIARAHGDGPTAVVGAVDRWLYQRLSNAAMFLTLAIGEWNTTTKKLTVANSGHSPIVWCSGNDVERIQASAPPLGVIADLAPDPWATTTRAGDLLVLATDGFTEQANPAGELFGEDHFDATVLGHASELGCTAELKHSPAGLARMIGDALLADLAAHGDGCARSDDQTLMVVSFS